MLEIGHEFKRNGVQFCVVDIISYRNRKYCFLSEEKKNEKVNFHFYEYKVDYKGDAILNIVNDKNLISMLFELLERGNKVYE